MEWKNFKELMEWAMNNFKVCDQNDTEQYNHGTEYWYGYNEALSCIATNLFPKEYFGYLMESWSKVE